MSKERHYRIHSHCWSQVCSKCNTGKKEKKVDLRPCSAVTELFLVPASATETCHGCDPVTDTSNCGGQPESVTSDLQMYWALTASHHLISYHPSSYWNILTVECLTVIRDFVKQALGTADGKIQWRTITDLEARFTLFSCWLKVSYYGSEDKNCKKQACLTTARETRNVISQAARPCQYPAPIISTLQSPIRRVWIRIKFSLTFSCLCKTKSSYYFKTFLIYTYYIIQFC